MDVPYDEWVEIMVSAENYGRRRSRGFCYYGNMEIAQMLADRIGVDMHRYIKETYYDLRDK